MTRFLTRLLTVAWLATSSTSPGAAAQAPASQAHPDAAKLGKAMVVARLVQPPDLAIPLALVALEKAFGEAVAAGAGKDRAAIEAEDPGMVGGIWSAMKPIMTTYLHKELPDLHDRLALLYASRLTQAELDQLATFYASGTGRKIIGQMHTAFDAGPMVREMIANAESGGTLQVSEGAMKAGTQAALHGLPALITPQDETALQVLARIIPMAKLKAIGLEVQKLVLDWSNTDDPKFNRDIDAAIDDFLAARTKDAPRKPGK